MRPARTSPGRAAIVLSAALLLLPLAGCHAAGAGGRGGDGSREGERLRMVDEQLQRRGIRDVRVLEAMGEIPRHRFVPLLQRDRAYRDQPLPIGYGQTISQPYVVALMCELLEVGPEDRVLEIGTGSGYHAAVLSRLAGSVYSIEILKALADRAREALDSLGYDNVRVRHGDGYRGWPDAAPFDAVLLTAAPSRIPQPLLDQLADGGRLVAPVGEGFQDLVRITRTGDRYHREEIAIVQFVPMTGEAEDRNGH